MRVGDMSQPPLRALIIRSGEATQAAVSNRSVVAQTLATSALSLGTGGGAAGKRRRTEDTLTPHPGGGIPDSAAGSSMDHTAGAAVAGGAEEPGALEAGESYSLTCLACGGSWSTSSDVVRVTMEGASGAEGGRSRHDRRSQATTDRSLPNPRYAR